MKSYWLRVFEAAANLIDKHGMDGDTAYKMARNIVDEQDGQLALSVANV